MKYTKDQLRAIKTILNDRQPWMKCARHLTYSDHNSERNLVLNDTTLLLLNESVWDDGEEYEVQRLIRSNETSDIETGFAVNPTATHSDGKYLYVKLGDNAYFDPRILKRAFRALKYRGQTVTLQYKVDSRTQQRYCLCLTVATEWGYGMVMACRIRDESGLVKVLR